MAESPALLDSSGAPIPTKVIEQARQRARASLGGSGGQFFPYEAAQWTTPEMGNWLPWIRSPDNEINLYRDRMVARTRDLVRNDGWAAGAITRILDNTIGVAYRLIANPDYRALALYDKAFDADWAQEFRRAAEALWRSYAQDLCHYNDVACQLTVSQQFRLALRHKLVDAESLSVTYWLPERVGAGGARYATAFQIVDPDRLSNPYQQVDTRYLRGGVEIDELGVPLAYHIRRAHQNDWYNAIEAMEWERVAREDADGWRRVIHDFDRDRAGQNRGVSIFAPILSRLKMLANYYGVELQAAAINAVFGTFITSKFDQMQVMDSLDDGGNGGLKGIEALAGFRDGWHDQRKLSLNGARIPVLPPGDSIETVRAERPNSQFSPFTHEMLRGVAAALGVSAEQVTQDYSETNYSSARAAIVEAEKTFNRRCGEFDHNTATPFYANWLWEAMERRELPLPRNAPDFREARTAYARCRWLGPARGWVDPVAERQGAILGLDAGFSTLEEECAAQGLDWEENLEQRAREVARFRELDLPLPEWGGQKVTATEAAQKPERPQAA